MKISPYHPYSRIPLRRIPLMLLLGMLMIISGGCVKNEFMMIFNLPQNINSTYRLTYYASDPRGGIQIETAIAVAAGNAEVKGVTRYPTLVTLNSVNSDIPALIFYAGRGDKITISGDSDDPLGWKADGNKINTGLSQWRLEHKQAIEAARRASMNTSDAAPLRRLNDLVKDYVNAHPKSAEAVILLYSYFDASLQPSEFQKLIRTVEDSGAADDFMNLFARQDVLTASLPSDLKRLEPTELSLRTFDNNLDTLSLATGHHPVLIYWWQRRDESHKLITDTLKALVRWRPDSASMPIADISLTNDSSSWASGVRRDSLRHTMRAFSPAGFADPDAIRLGVRRTPWFIVVTTKGKVAYSGDDVAKAAGEFRKLRPSK